MKIVTNHHPRELLTVDQLPESEQHWFDYITGEDRFSPRIVAYRGSFYDVNEYTYTSDQMRIDHPEFAAWDGYQSDSYFSGTVVRWPVIDGRTDYESIVIGTYY